MPALRLHPRRAAGRLSGAPGLRCRRCRDRRDGRHENPTGDPAYFTTAYFHRPEELAAEFMAAGWVHQATLAVEGPGWAVGHRP